MKTVSCIISLFACALFANTALAQEFPISNGRYCDQSQNSEFPELEEIGDGSITVSYPNVSFNEYSSCVVKSYKKIDDDYKVVISCENEAETFEVKDLWTITSDSEFELNEIRYQKCDPP